MNWDLTPSELAVLELLCDGLSSTEIAERRYVSITTIRSQIRGIFMKYGVSTITAAVVIHLKQGATNDHREFVG